VRGRRELARKKEEDKEEDLMGSNGAAARNDDKVGREDRLVLHQCLHQGKVLLP